MFTNRIGKDGDIEHAYNRYLFLFLFFKWKYDSLMTDFPNKRRLFLIIIHWIIILNQKLWIIGIANIVFGYFTAVMLVGNHEQE